MKKITALLILLLILVIPIFLKITGRKLTSHSPDPPSETPPEFAASVSPRMESHSSKKSTHALSLRKPSSSEPDFQTTPSHPSHSDSAHSLQTLDSRSRFYFLKSQSIVPLSSRDELFHENLQNLTEEFLLSLNPEAFVFDIDGNSTLNSPVVFSSNDSLNLTPFLKELFENRHGISSEPPGDE